MEILNEMRLMFLSRSENESFARVFLKHFAERRAVKIKEKGDFVKLQFVRKVRVNIGLDFFKSFVSLLVLFYLVAVYVLSYKLN